MKTFRNVGRLLSGHRVRDEQRLAGFYDGGHRLEFLHQPFVDLQPSGGVDDDGGDAEALRFGDGIASDFHGVRCTARIDRKIDLFPERLQLLDGGRTVDVGRNQHAAAALLL